MTKKYYLVVLFFSFYSIIQAQKITGVFPLLKNQKIRLIGNNGLNKYVIDSTTFSEEGKFVLNYSSKDLGIGFINDNENRNFIIVLEKDDIEIEGQTFSMPESVLVKKGIENKLFTDFLETHTKIDKALRQLRYTNQIYQEDIFFSDQKNMIKSIQFEIDRLENFDNNNIKKIDLNTYIYWYISIRKLIAKIPTVVQLNSKDRLAYISNFRSLDYNNPKLYKSGLMNDLLEGQYWLIENSGLTQDSIYTQMNITTESILNSISENEQLYNEISKYLYDYFEKHSLFKASSYLSSKALSQKSVKIYDKQFKQFQSYNEMKIGNIASDIIFSGDIYKNNNQIENSLKLSNIEAKYKVIIFGASWCQSCTDEMIKLFPIYNFWKSKGIEVIFVSMDTDKDVFKKYISVMPFYSFCDYKKWDTQSVKDYYVNSSPTIYLLDKSNKIIMRSGLILAIDAWVKSYLAKG
jgi:thiol-disulfide isomerase/thioredoxin